jgi:uncharacterized protein (DUF1330 family)
MPKGYAIFTGNITDPDAMGPYAQAALGTILAVGGNPIVASPPVDTIEGERYGNQTVVVESPSVEVAQTWYHSPEYQAVIGMRLAAAQSNAIIISGFEMPSG